MAAGMLTVLTPFLAEGGPAAVQIGGSVGGDEVTGSTTSPVFDQRGRQVQEQTHVAGDLIKN
ncbi:MAG TPA: hypothetical protein PKY49_08810 [Anaerolineae bacterium]|nr:hypothetical protein [Anaerolineae bacterium]